MHTLTHTLSAEAANTTNRIIFLTDLQSTCDTANDEKRLLSTIRSNADAGIYTTVVGIGMVRTYVWFSVNRAVTGFGDTLSRAVTGFSDTLSRAVTGFSETVSRVVTGFGDTLN